jgi:hypothetical protein
MIRSRFIYRRAGVTLLMILGIAGVANSVIGSDEAPEVVRAPDSNFPDASIEPLEEMISPLDRSVSLEPPSADATPAITGKEAVEIGEDQLGPSAHPSRVTASLAEGTAGKLVWAVFFKGVCVPEFGPIREGEPFVCGSDELIVLVDAETGAVDGVFSFR